LNELKEYAAEVDVDFVRKSVRAIGKCAVKLNDAAERCINTLLDLIKTKVNYVVQESIIVIKDIFRKYPNRYESLIPTLCENLEELDESEAKASMIWIVGEYAEKIQNAAELLTSFLETFEEDTPLVQLQLLTAIVKLFLKKPNSAKDLVQQVLQLATTKSDNADLRDRGFVYWRLLSTDPNTTKAVVLAEKPPITIDTTDGYTGSLLDELIDSIGTLASVYHKPASAFLAQGKLAPAVIDTTPRNISEITEDMVQKGEDDNDESVLGGGSNPQANQSSGNSNDLLGLDEDEVRPNIGGASSGLGGGGGNLLDLLEDNPAPKQANALFGGFQDLLGGLGGGLGGGPTVLPKQVWLAAQQGQGFEIQGTFSRKNGITSMEMTFMNSSGAPLTDFAIQFNKNSFGLAPASPLKVNSPLLPGQRADTVLPLNFSGQKMKMSPLNALQVAIKNNVQVFYFQCLIPLYVLFTEDGRLDVTEYTQLWQTTQGEQVVTVTGLSGYSSVDVFKNKFNANNMVVLTQRKVNNMDSFLVSTKVLSQFVVLLEIVIHPSLQSVRAVVKSQTVDILPVCQHGLELLLKAQ